MPRMSYIIEVKFDACPLVRNVPAVQFTRARRSLHGTDAYKASCISSRHTSRTNLSFTICLSPSASGSRCRASRTHLRPWLRRAAQVAVVKTSPRPKMGQRSLVDWSVSFRVQLTAPGRPSRLLLIAVDFRLRQLLISKGLIVLPRSLGRGVGYPRPLNQPTLS